MSRAGARSRSPFVKRPQAMTKQQQRRTRRRPESTSTNSNCGSSVSVCPRGSNITASTAISRKRSILMKSWPSSCIRLLSCGATPTTESCIPAPIHRAGGGGANMTGRSTFTTCIGLSRSASWRRHPTCISLRPLSGTCRSSVSSGVVVLVNRKNPAKPRYIILASTALELDGRKLVELYAARFQIEFLFRDSKQFTGLADCQARTEVALDFHFNASLATLNLARAEELLAAPDQSPQVFSMASWKQRKFNERLLDLFIERFALDQTWVKNQPGYDELRTYGAIAA